MPRFRNALRALLRPDLSLPDHRDALDALARRVAALEAAQADCLAVVESEADRATRWVDMSNQLRRFLGRLDKHAGLDRSQDDAGTSQDPKLLAAILRSKFHYNGG